MESFLSAVADASPRRSGWLAHGSTAVRGAATTGAGTAEAVIDGKLFSCPDFSETIQEHLPTNSAHRQIRITAVINELRATSPYRPIERRTPVHANHVDPTCFLRQEHPCGAARNFPLADPLAGILDHPLTRRDCFFCEYTKPFDSRTADAESKADEIRVETRAMLLRGHIKREDKSGDANPDSKNWHPRTRTPLIQWSLLDDRHEWFGMLQGVDLFELLGSLLLCHGSSPCPGWTQERARRYMQTAGQSPLSETRGRCSLECRQCRSSDAFGEISATRGR
jgi:hypothetical protein